MVKQNLLIPAEEIEKKYQRKDEKKKKRMKVSGAGVKRLLKIIKEK
ncbi:MAG: hypothetical protein WC608_05805 [Parcubacteria group bacterium]